VSAGCKHCYAETFSERFRGVSGHPFEQGFDLRLVPEKLSEPLRWTRQRRVFVNSMSDLFHEGIASEYVRVVFEAMFLADWHVFQVLTKRPHRLKNILADIGSDLVAQRHIWIGVSVENRRHGLPRIDQLRESKARTRFLSIEPLLEDLGKIDLSGIDWVIVGGESGPKARPMQREWVLGILEQCREAHVPFFFKQWGGVRKKWHGRELNKRTYDDHPALVRGTVPAAIERARRHDVLQAMIESLPRHARQPLGSRLVQLSGERRPTRFTAA